METNAFEMKVKPIYESQGVDEDIERIARELAPVIMKENDELRERHDPNDALDQVLMFRSHELDMKLYDDNGNHIPYKVKVSTGYFPEWGKNYGMAQRVYDENNKDKYEFEITINMTVIYDMLSKGRILLEEVLAHELMHTKTHIREDFTRHDPRKPRLTAAVKSYNPGEKEGDDDYDPFLFNKYFLSGSEMASYVTGEYSYAKENTIRNIAAGNQVDKEWFTSLFKSSSAYKHICRVRKYIDTMVERDSQEIEDFIAFVGKDYLKKVLGVSTPADFERLFRKRLDDVTKKIVKAAYKGYVDGLKEKQQ